MYHRFGIFLYVLDITIFHFAHLQIESSFGTGLAHQIGDLVLKAVLAASSELCLSVI